MYPTGGWEDVPETQSPLQVWWRYLVVNLLDNLSPLIFYIRNSGHSVSVFTLLKFSFPESVITVYNVAPVLSTSVIYTTNIPLIIESSFVKGIELKPSSVFFFSTSTLFIAFSGPWYLMNKCFGPSLSFFCLP